MREERIPPQRGSKEAAQLNEVGVCHVGAGGRRIGAQASLTRTEPI